MLLLISPGMSEILHDKFPKIIIFLKTVYRVGKSLASELRHLLPEHQDLSSIPGTHVGS